MAYSRRKDRNVSTRDRSSRSRHSNRHAYVDDAGYNRGEDWRDAASEEQSARRSPRRDGSTRRIYGEDNDDRQPRRARPSSPRGPAGDRRGYAADWADDDKDWSRSDSGWDESGANWDDSGRRRGFRERSGGWVA